MQVSDAKGLVLSGTILPIIINIAAIVAPKEFIKQLQDIDHYDGVLTTQYKIKLKSKSV